MAFPDRKTVEVLLTLLLFGAVLGDWRVPC
jgi:hypothetical protein